MITQTKGMIKMHSSFPHWFSSSSFLKRHVATKIEVLLENFKYTEAL
jgi:hypothetical protein